MTQRAIEVLRNVPWVAAEDTRHSAPLLRHFGVTAHLLAAHEHNEEAAAQQIIVRLAAGESVALVTDAGTPAVSDPGARLVARVRGGYGVVCGGDRCAAFSVLRIFTGQSGAARVRVTRSRRLAVRAGIL